MRDFFDEMVEQIDLHDQWIIEALRPCKITLNDGTEIEGECECVEPYWCEDRYVCVHAYDLYGNGIAPSEYKRLVTI